MDIKVKEAILAGASSDAQNFDEMLYEAVANHVEDAGIDINNVSEDDFQAAMDLYVDEVVRLISNPSED